MTTVEAATQIGTAMKVLIEAGMCESFDAAHAAMTVTPQGGTPERHAILEALR